MGAVVEDDTRAANELLSADDIFLRASRYETFVAPVKV